MISACPNRYTDCVEPLVYSRSDGQEALFLFEGSGSWGAGAKAAAWFREHIADRHEASTVFTPDSITETLTYLIHRLPKQFSEDDFGWQFSLAVAIVGHNKVYVSAAGSFSAVVTHARTNTVEHLVKPIRLVDELVLRGNIPASEAKTHPLRHIVCGPFFGMERVVPLIWTEHSLLRSGDRIVLGDPALPSFFDTVPFDPLEVKMLRDEIERFGGRSSPTAIVTIGAL